MESIIAHFFAFRNKLALNHFFYSLVVLLLVVGSFFLGLSTRFMDSRPSFTFVSKEEEDARFEREKDELFGIKAVSTSTIVASKTGKKYYFVWCKGATNIKDSKKVYFDTEALAQKAGYTLAANCK